MKKLLLALALVALLLTWGDYGAQQAEAQAVDLSIRVSAAGCTTAGGPTTCNVPVNTQFTVTMKVEVVPPGPPGDFDTFQGYLTHTAGLTLVKRPGTGEIVWVCDLPAWQSGAGWFRGGCAQMFSPPATQPIDVMEVDYTCGASPSTETVTMRHGSATSETFLRDSTGTTHEEAGTESLTINCQALPEACCFPDGSCQNLIPSDCTTQGGTPGGPGSACLGIAACAFPDGSCADIDAFCCLNEGGDPGGPGSVCLGVEACCYPDDSCGDHDAYSCLVAGGTPEGAGTNCAETVCGAAPPEIKWEQWPDEWGLDVGTLDPGVPLVLADDFLCDESGLITEIDFWASWYHDAAPGEPPFGDPNLVQFTLSLHSDVPAGEDLPWSHPGELLWEYWFDPYQCIVEPWAFDVEEGWFFPPTGYYDPFADTQIWLYICPIPEPYWFQQEEGTIYWLDIQAVPIEPGFFFGWKTSIDHWNDASVWTTEPEPVDPLHWFDLWHPPGHPLYGNPIDLAFQIWGQPCPAGVDSDLDGFTDDVECYLPTDFRDDCPDDLSHDAWPLDNNMDTFVTVVPDVLTYRGRMNTTGGPPADPMWMQRLDLNADNYITVVPDILYYRGNMNTGC